MGYDPGHRQQQSAQPIAAKSGSHGAWVEALGAGRLALVTEERVGRRSAYASIVFGHDCGIAIA